MIKLFLLEEFFIKGHRILNFHFLTFKGKITYLSVEDIIVIILK